MEQGYCLKPGVQVRREEFGLLFYDMQGPKLTFVHSGPWLQPEFFTTNKSLEEWLLQGFPHLRPAQRYQTLQTLKKALVRLHDKGLITLGAP